MFLSRSKNTHDSTWKRMGLKNKLTVLALIDNLIKKDEECRKSKTRAHKRALRKAEDRKNFEIQHERVERQNKMDVVALCRREDELEKHKKERINNTNRRLNKLQNEERERVKYLTKICKNAKIQTQKMHEKERNEGMDREKKLMEAEIWKINASNRKIRNLEERNKAQQNAMKKRISESDRTNMKSRVHGVHNGEIRNKTQKRIVESLKRFQKLEEKYEEEATTFVERMNQLEKEKNRQKEKLKKRNEEFKSELERRKKISKLQRQTHEEWKLDYIGKLKTRITDIEKRTDKKKVEFCNEVIAIEYKRKKDEDVNCSRRQRIQNEQTLDDENMLKRISEMATKKEDETDKVVDAIQKIRKMKSILEIDHGSDVESKTDNENENEEVDERRRTTQVESDLETQEEEIDEEEIKRRTKLKWEIEAKAREEQKVKDEFRKLMGGFGSKTKTFPH